jgi:hypothetical protein
VLPARERADQRDALARARKRQQIAVILEHDNRPASRVPGERDRFRKHRPRSFPALVDAAERIVEQPDHRLGRQHPPHRLVEPRHRHFASAHQIGEVLAVVAALHAHIDAGQEG